LPERRFPPPWSVEETDACFIVRNANVQAIAYVYFEDELGRRAARNSSRATTRGVSPPTSRSCCCPEMGDAGPESHRLLRVSRALFESCCPWSFPFRTMASSPTNGPDLDLGGDG